MITFGYPVAAKDGALLDLICPVIVCDVCGDFIDADSPGNYEWDRDDERRAWQVHHGCSRALMAQLGIRTAWRPIATWLEQLTHNFHSPVKSERVFDGANNEKIPVSHWATKEDNRR